MLLNFPKVIVEVSDKGIELWLEDSGDAKYQLLLFSEIGEFWAVLLFEKSFKDLFIYFNLI